MYNKYYDTIFIVELWKKWECNWCCFHWYNIFISYLWIIV